MFKKEKSLNQSTFELLKNDFDERHKNLNEQINGLIQKEDEQFTLLNARTNEHDSILMDHNNDLNRIHTSQSEYNENFSKMETIVQNHDSDIKNINVVLGKTEEILRKAWLAIIFSLIVAGLGLLLAIIILVR